jgi:hypothetical protein
MTEEELRHSIEKNEVKLTFWGKIIHYGVVGYLIFIMAMFLFLQLTNTGNSPLKPLNGGEFWVFMVLILLIFFIYKLQRKRLKFKSVETGLKRKEINDIIREVASELKWTLHSVNENYIVAKTHPGFFSGSWGEQITIIFDRDRVLVNSICDPDKRSSVTSMGRNRRNENKLMNEIKIRTTNTYQSNWGN